MILFAADNHYGKHCGRVLNSQIKDRYSIEFHEDDWSCFETGGLIETYDLIILNLIAGACDIPPPSEQGEANVKAYLEAGGSMLLLHGASAAFWSCDWWRAIVGHRWVRGNDPDGFDASTHPRRPYRLDVAKCRHPLCTKLTSIDLPEDEIYINLEQTASTTVLMTTTTDEGTFVQAYETFTPWGGRILAYIPGHEKEVVGNEVMVGNCTVLIDDLLP
ncbi:MAG: hypothetical protein HN742_24700 [Lentisphaerae bacterium]|jgi:hypothetical protein|nr:hypothetical protein [Lentisphaerota bacterium]MBT4822919.1 hypothetical protein [Lentisphaerota bacterium]MBT5609768.1 hypothetical protein [Lentisphaerota bacterium]MBT7061410.1 hypothetical protein [Lentisphaerota bacterium]MBT7845100.1 hypothetical protein [Lentisphaerota bacterium]